MPRQSRGQGPRHSARQRVTDDDRPLLAPDVSRRNLVHGSDSVESAEREIALFFEAQSLIEWTRDTDRWIFE